MAMKLLVGIGIIILWVYVLYVGVFIPGLINEKLPKIEEIRDKAKRNLLNSKYQIWDQNRS
jgi:uncharacterized membrane-anchored protein